MAFDIFFNHVIRYVTRTKCSISMSHAVALGNATYRLNGHEPARARYLLLTFRVTAASDDKRELLLDLAVNESNGALADLPEAARAALLELPAAAAPDAPADPGLGEGWDGARAAAFCRRALPGRIRHGIRPFLTAMQRRMQRDLERIHAYHVELYREAERRMAARREKGEPEAALAGDTLRLQAVAREYRAKAADLQRKYAVAVKVEILQAIRVVVPVLRLRLQLLRRKGVRPYHLDWNPLARKLDRLACEACGGDAPARWLCDDGLHLLCPACFAACPRCDKPWCRVCHPEHCPRCQH